VRRQTEENGVEDNLFGSQRQLSIESMQKRLVSPTWEVSVDGEVMRNCMKAEARMMMREARRDEPSLKSRLPVIWLPLTEVTEYLSASNIQAL
jgi:hypothetical protein